MTGRPRKATDTQILAAARALLLERGPHISLNEMGAAVGMTGAALQQRFGTKKTLMMRALLPENETDWDALILTATHNANTPRDALATLAREIYAVLSRIARAQPVLQAAGFGREHIWGEAPQPPPEQAVATLARWLEREDRAGRLRAPAPRNTALLLLGSLHFRAFLMPNTPPSPAEIAADVDALWTGLAPGDTP